MNNHAMPKWRPDQNARLAIAAHELLMAVHKHREPRLAFDALTPELKQVLGLDKNDPWLKKKGYDMKRYARDAAPPDADAGYNRDKINELMTWLEGKLPDDLGEAMDRLDAAFPGCVGDLPDREDADNDVTEDEPPPFKGRPTPGGKPLPLYGEDSSSYNAMFPMAARIKGDLCIPMPPNPSNTPSLAMDSMSDEDEASFNEMFPGAARIGVLP